MTVIRLEPVGGDDPELKATLIEAHLPTDDIRDEGRSLFKAVAEDGATGIEACGDASLLRPLVVLPDHRGKGFGRIVTRLTLDRAEGAVDIYLATTTASEFFKDLGFAVVDRSAVPELFLSTRQLSGICPASATVMKLTRPPS
ncbi:GNAT family N-acetyltransferase [Agrobacterium rubi]|uniref:GNAT family N-acetyltransferase n=1 Tax=Agrobacterium rubi TaxID=28099 RepID=UPI001573E52B|nr:GNAT family N-acetyltransferase [Agrobacterium rubi]NTF10728.1 GNAT family N-acetyltransferase [Agrobacterium rubi]NTF23142.1 GNAT family N-acetyltransferase [Agrobacterium rubi]NTF30062.1 GNAT family N-acetyltransferase [Agrobacterium rubi]